MDGGAVELMVLGDLKWMDRGIKRLHDILQGWGNDRGTVLVPDVESAAVLPRFFNGCSDLAADAVNTLTIDGSPIAAGIFHFYDLEERKSRNLVPPHPPRVQVSLVCEAKRLSL